MTHSSSRIAGKILIRMDVTFPDMALVEKNIETARALDAPWDPRGDGAAGRSGEGAAREVHRAIALRRLAWYNG